jgi:hypothetical protein
LLEQLHALSQLGKLRFDALTIVWIHRRQLYRKEVSISSLLMHPIDREKCSESAGGDCIVTVLWWELPADNPMKPGCKISVDSGFGFSQYRGGIYQGTGFTGNLFSAD